MKVLHVVQGYAPAIGGTEWLIQHVSEELVHSFGDEVTVFTTNCYNGEGFWNPALPRMPTGATIMNGVKIVRYPVNSRLSQSLRPFQKIAHVLDLPYNDWLRTYFGGPIISGLRKNVAAYPADVVASSSFPLLHMFDTLAGAKAGKKPVILHGGIHPQDTWGFKRKNIYSAIRQADVYLANTEFEADFLSEKGINRNNIIIVGCGVQPEHFSILNKEEARKRLNLPQDRPIIGFIGQIGTHKGIDTLIKAMTGVWQDYPNATLLIAGSRALYSQQLDNLVSSWPEEHKKRLSLFYNFREEEKPYLFNAIDIFAYPSGYESFGIAYLEAWAARKPVIGTWRGAIPWVIDAGKDGILVPFQNHQLLAEAIRILLRYPQWAAELGENGYKKVVSQYTWEKVASRFRDAYSFALEKGKKCSEVQITAGN